MPEGKNHDIERSHSKEANIFIFILLLFIYKYWNDCSCETEHNCQDRMIDIAS